MKSRGARLIICFWAPIIIEVTAVWGISLTPEAANWWYLLALFLSVLIPLAYLFAFAPTAKVFSVYAPLVLQSALLGASWDVYRVFSQVSTLERSDVMTEMRALMITRVIVSGISLAIGFAFGQSRNRRTLTAVAALLWFGAGYSAFYLLGTVKMVEKELSGPMRTAGRAEAPPYAPSSLR
jgi:hypothetical protein